jgi:sulfite exporter TauE/SafE
MYFPIEIIVTALLLGLAGSFHCIGMCGPIALAVPLKATDTFSKTISILAYNLGRTITYSIMGAFFGLAGKSLVIAGWQQGLSIFIGILIIIGVILSYLNISWLSRFSVGHWSFLSKKLGVLLKQKSYSSNLFIGILNGLLPCGLVYAGIAGAIATGSPSKGALFMFMFGIGTSFLMFTLQFFKEYISTSVRNLMRKAVPIYLVIMATLLILRGLNLGIPYISPVLSDKEAKAEKCCHR